MLPSATDTTLEADIVRIQFYRNTVYAHANQASVDDLTFSSHWKDIRDTLVRLGGSSYAAAIDSLANDSMDPEIEEHYKDMIDKLEKKLDDLVNPEKRQVTEPFDLEECQKQLRSIYNTMSKVQIIPWDPSSAMPIDEIYTPLSLLEDHRKPCGVRKRRLKDYTEIFNSQKHHPKPKRLLVYGRPGIGKSTFCKKTAFDWSQQREQLLEEFDLVLLIRLRDVSSLQDVPAILRASEVLASDSVISADDMYDYILQHQEKVLLILDGYDEYGGGKQSPVREIWERKQLRDCCVILTTRQTKADELASDAQFEINGLDSENQVKKFTGYFLSNEKDVEDFYKYLEKQDLMGMVGIPLLLLMLCLLWKEKHGGRLPTSRADIYTQFIQTLLDHMSAKDANSEVFKKLDDYSEELSRLGKHAFDALLQDALCIPLSELSDDLLVTTLIEVGLFQVSYLSSLSPEKGVYFIHKSVQEFLAAWYLKEELLSGKGESATSLHTIDSSEKVYKMSEVLKLASELSETTACTVLRHLGIIGKKEGLTEYSFDTETPSIEDLTPHQYRFLSISQSCLFCSPAAYSAFATYTCGILLLTSDQLHSFANEHLLRSAEPPNYIFFSGSKNPERDYSELVTVVEDLNAVVVSVSQELKASEFLKKHSVRPVKEFFLMKEENMHLYIACIDKAFEDSLPTEMLRELIASPESTSQKKRETGTDQSNEKSSRTDLCPYPTHHCLSRVREIFCNGLESQGVEMLTDVLHFVSSPPVISIYGREGVIYDPQLAESLFSCVNFTDRTRTFGLGGINVTAECAATIAESLYKAPNLRGLDLSLNPLGEGVSVLAGHLSCVPHLENLEIENVKMTKEQVNDLTTALRQSKITCLRSHYHDRKGNPIPEGRWPQEDYWKRQHTWDVPKPSTKSEDRFGRGLPAESEDVHDELEEKYKPKPLKTDYNHPSGDDYDYGCPSGDDFDYGDDYGFPSGDDFDYGDDYGFLYGDDFDYGDDYGFPYGNDFDYGDDYGFPSGVDCDFDYGYD